MIYEHIRVERSPAAVATLILARPQALNAFNPLMLEEMRHAVEELRTTGARCLLIAAEGRGFSSGADLATGLPEDVGEALEKYYNPLIKALFDLPLPIVASVNGPAAGAGCSVALAADIVVAGRSAYFLQAFVNVGLVPDAGATWMLPRLVGRRRAIEMMMLGERISADEALNLGLISHVVEDEHLAAEAMKVATRLAEGPTVALGLIRKLARDAEQLSIGDALAAERIAQRDAGRTEDFKTGAMAFLSKQKAKFEGR